MRKLWQHSDHESLKILLEKWTKFGNICWPQWWRISLHCIYYIIYTMILWIFHGMSEVHVGEWVDAYVYIWFLLMCLVFIQWFFKSLQAWVMLILVSDLAYVYIRFFLLTWCLLAEVRTFLWSTFNAFERWQFKSYQYQRLASYLLVTISYISDNSCRESSHLPLSLYIFLFSIP